MVASTLPREILVPRYFFKDNSRGANDLGVLRKISKNRWLTVLISTTQSRSPIRPSARAYPVMLFMKSLSLSFLIEKGIFDGVHSEASLYPLTHNQDRSRGGL